MKYIYLVAAAVSLADDRPGLAGFPLWAYASFEDAFDKLDTVAAGAGLEPVPLDVPNWWVYRIAGKPRGRDLFHIVRMPFGVVENREGNDIEKT